MDKQGKIVKEISERLESKKQKKEEEEFVPTFFKSHISFCPDTYLTPAPVKDEFLVQALSARPSKRTFNSESLCLLDFAARLNAVSLVGQYVCIVTEIGAIFGNYHEHGQTFGDPIYI